MYKNKSMFAKTENLALETREIQTSKTSYIGWRGAT